VRRFFVTVNGERYEVTVEEVQAEGEGSTSGAPPAAPAHMAAPPVPAPRPTSLERAATAAPRGGVVGEGVVKAPLPGAILAVKVAVGETVSAGQVLVLLEAMKMENEIASPIDGHVRDVRVAAGDAVGLGDVLCVVEA
jgi:glutaconyl-CoA/methylmalonyl-CoA decarboxylase subunit gamma